MKKILLSTAVIFNAFILSAQTFKDATPLSFVQGIDNQCSAASGDLNGDGYPDIILTGRENSSGLHKTWLYLNDGTGNFTLSANSGITIGMKHSDISLGDYDGDGDLDVVMQGWEWNAVASTNTQRAYVYQNDGTGVFTRVATLDGRSNGTIEFGDYDNDGKMDILQTGWKDDGVNPSGGKTTLYHNDENNVFSIVNSVSLFAIADGEARFGDYDKDGNLDIIICGWMQTRLYKGNGAGSFIDQNVTLPAYDWSYVSWIDYDKDGFLDLLIGGHYNDNGDHYATKVLKGNGTNTFVDQNLGLTNVQRGPVKIGDCNNDGKIDFFISGWGGDPANGGLGGVFQIHKSEGSSYSPIAGINTLITGWADGAMAVADFDGDGYDDIFKCGWSLTKLYMNTTRNNTNIDITEGDSFSIVMENTLLHVKSVLTDSSTSVNIYDISGKPVYNYSFDGIESTSDLSALSRGVYLVGIRNQQVNAVKTIFVE